MRETVAEVDLELAAVQAMAAVLTCGPIWGSYPGLQEDSQTYAWLNNMLGSRDDRVNYCLAVKCFFRSSPCGLLLLAGLCFCFDVNYVTSCI